LTDKNENTLIFVGAKLDAATNTYRDVFGSNYLPQTLKESPVVYDFSEPSPPGKADESSLN
jgi:hypothetical protein